MLEIDSITKDFGLRNILSGCYLNCRKGEVVGLLGRNGSGKSTLLKIIFGSVKANFMHLRIDGEIIGRGNTSKKIAYLPQQSFFPPFFKVGQLLYEVSPQLLSKPILLYLNKINTNTVNSLSGGELKFLECLWILSRPVPYVLLDEPFSGISPLQIELIQEAISLSSDSKGIILTDHLYRPLLEISTRIVLLHNKSNYAIEDESDLIRFQYIPDYLS